LRHGVVQKVRMFAISRALRDRGRSAAGARR
jgi:hypothetical protein